MKINLVIAFVFLTLSLSAGAEKDPCNPKDFPKCLASYKDVRELANRLSFKLVGLSQIGNKTQAVVEVPNLNNPNKVISAWLEKGNTVNGFKIKEINRKEDKVIVCKDGSEFMAVLGKGSTFNTKPSSTKLKTIHLTSVQVGTGFMVPDGRPAGEVSIEFEVQEIDGNLQIKQNGNVIYSDDAPEQFDHLMSASVPEGPPGEYEKEEIQMQLERIKELSPVSALIPADDKFPFISDEIIKQAKSVHFFYPKSEPIEGTSGMKKPLYSQRFIKAVRTDKKIYFVNEFNQIVGEL